LKYYLTLVELVLLHFVFQICMDTLNTLPIGVSLKKVKIEQRRIFIFGALGCFEFGAYLEGSRRLMLYKLAPHVLAIFTEQVVAVHKHISLF